MCVGLCMCVSECASGMCVLSRAYRGYVYLITADVSVPWSEIIYIISAMVYMCILID